MTFISNFMKELVDRIGFMLDGGKLQFFGLNGKCCTDNLFTNYLMDLFPISGDVAKNSFNYAQIKGESFNKIMKNFIFNTEGGKVLRVNSFCRYVVDHADERRAAVNNIYTIAVIFLWHTPEDINKVVYNLYSFSKSS